MAATFRMTVGMRKRHKDVPVFFKQDGKRFPLSKTVKLNVNTPYNVIIALEPPRLLERVIIHGDPLTPKLLEGNSSKSVFLQEWSSESADFSPSGKRTDITFIIEFQESITMKTTLQCKFYKQKEKDHCLWGTRLNGIEYLCRIPEGSTYAEIMEEQYL
ncbi:Hypothetical predicted protein [Octopus vulgaris]|uniref:Uncharacterized protein n=2 Tax=Octopus TaxID=6643 RepID=A0AA36AVE8_OCTVU|nr:CB1 cannabinoid receptor-interacting protein 1 [Octopus sinensis]CAI9722459.1 Hypothetical predicted protein [Octopus vulgaris]